MDLALDLCLTYSWLFDCKMTDIFIRRPWEKAPHDWTDILCAMSYIELRDLVKGKVHSEWPVTLQAFSKSLSQTRGCLTKQWDSSITLSPSLQKGMSEKKRHEVRRMASLVGELCKEDGCNLIGDIGAGLGYLGQTLMSTFKLNVLGFELEDGNCQNWRMQRATSNNLQTRCLRVDTSSECTQILRDSFRQHHSSVSATDICADSKVQQGSFSEQAGENFTPSSSSSFRETDECRVCMVGLHCCGDLTPATLHQFHTIEECKTLVCLGCCYHRLSLDAHFGNFPMSSQFKSWYQDSASQHGCSINHLALRLACQEPKSRWLARTDGEMEKHCEHVAFRAVLELYSHRKGFNWHKKHRRLVGLSAFSSFETYIDAVLERVGDVEGLSISMVKTALSDTYTECKEFFSYIRWYDALQVMLQELLEFVILRDRQQYLREKGYLCQLVSLFDDKISPRSIAIIAQKT
ncbi:methyltransferase-like protein 25B [Watersipora subatra]|uniref:methyltransferase-like protein 25B n=1 Tax=Watersipora subatra TaxID=2589382 RepID=UPI00355BAA2F